MKPVIIIAVAFVLLIPLNAFAQEIDITDFGTIIIGNGTSLETIAIITGNDTTRTFVSVIGTSNIETVALRILNEQCGDILRQMNDTKTKLSQLEIERFEEIYNNCVEDQVEKYIHGDLVIDELSDLKEDNRQIFEQNAFLTSIIIELKEQNQILQKQVSDSTNNTIIITVLVGTVTFSAGILVDRRIKSRK